MWLASAFRPQFLESPRRNFSKNARVWFVVRELRESV